MLLKRVGGSMTKALGRGAAILTILVLLVPLRAQESNSWSDPSLHRVQFVTVDDNVRLEVLDWGGSGRPLILLAGLGNTAHVFDDFAPKLIDRYHVFGITRRGYGASDVPDSGYTADRLGDDVLDVIDQLKLAQPVLVGHSVAGEELSSVGSRHPDRVAGLIYLDAAYRYAYDDGQPSGLWPTLEKLRQNLEELQKRAAALDTAGTKQLLEELLEKDVPESKGELEDFQKFLQVAPVAPPQPPRPAAVDLESFPAMRAWFVRVQGYAPPESEIRQENLATPSGGVGGRRNPPRVSQAITAGRQKYTDIRVPALAIFAVPHDEGPWAKIAEPAARLAIEAFSAMEAASTEKQAQAFEKGVAGARVIRLPHANHSVFLSNEAEVLSEMRAFLASLR
jgi:pimeloyl-ACP methyl ester carboxylesterase